MQKAVPQGAKTSDDSSRASHTPSRSAQQPGQGPGYIAQMAAMANSSPRAQLQRQLAAQIEGSSQVAAQRKLAAEVNAGSPASQHSLADDANTGATTAQLKTLQEKTVQTQGALDKKLKQPKFDDAVQTKKKEELRQHKVANGPAQFAAAPAPNKTGLPDNLKAGVESLSGVSLDSVKVHYNSPKPAQLNALAYAQGTDIHVAPGQEKHLPHEAWHITQQSQGRVKPTTQAKGVAINDDSHLEKEADVMGAKAVQLPVQRQVAQLGKHGKKGLTKKRAKERRIRENKDKPNNREWLPSGEIGQGEPPEGYATWMEWAKDKEKGGQMK